MEGLRLCPASALTSLDLAANHLTARAAAAISSVISGARSFRPTGCRLRSLSLACNSLGTEGARALCGGLTGGATLTCLNLADNQMRDEGMLALGRSLLESPAEHSRLCGLRCDAFVLDAQGTTLSLTHRSLGRAAATLLAGVARRHARLATLDLSRAYIGEEAGGKALARMLRTNTALCTLGIDGGQLPLHELRGVPGAPSAATAAAGGTAVATPSPEELDLSDRGLGPAAAHVLGSLLRANTTLTRLSLRGNRLGNAGAVALLNGLKDEAAAPHRFALRELDLRDNGPVQSRTAKALGLLVKLRW